MSTLIGYNEQGFIEKPATGWLHEDGDLIDGNSITYSISYVGMVPVFESINTWKQDLRTELVREAIVRLADHAQLLTANKKRKVSKKVQKVLGAPSKQWGCECRLALSVEDFAIKNGVNNREMFKHQINSISFASGGEGATIDFVAYVGKDTRSGRGCHIFNCPRKSHLVLLTMGQAFDLSYRRFKARKVQPLSVNQSGDGWGADSTPSGPTAGAYERFSNGRGMASSQPGVYDNFVPTSANDYESFPQRRGPESDLYGSTSSPGNGIYDNGMGQRQMKHSDDGIYDNGLGKSDGIYDNRPNNASEYEISPSTSNKIFDDPLYESLKGKPPEKDKMAYSQDGIYDNGLGGGQDGVYDNTPGQGRPTGKKGSEMEEDIYGGVGGDGEGVYDTAGGGRKGMKYSQDGIYDNPLAGKGWSCVL